MNCDSMDKASIECQRSSNSQLFDILNDFIKLLDNATIDHIQIKAIEFATE